MKDGYAYELNVQFETVSCSNCGALFGLPRETRTHLMDNGGTFYCPNGHPQHYKTSTEQQLREARAELKRERKRLEWAAQEVKTLLEQRDTYKHKARAEKAAKTRLKNRIGKGVCPCCNRHFANLQAHMERQHPDFTDDQGEG